MSRPNATSPRQLTPLVALRVPLASVESKSGVNIVKDQGYTNVFEDVHKKIKAFKDRLLEANKSNAELRENRVAQEAREMEVSDKA
jgi:hypothetical protein